MLKEETNDRTNCSSFSIQHSEFSISCHRLATEDGILLRLDGHPVLRRPRAVLPVPGPLVACGPWAGAKMGGDRHSLRRGPLLRAASSTKQRATAQRMPIATHFRTGPRPASDQRPRDRKNSARPTKNRVAVQPEKDSIFSGQTMAGNAEF